MSCFSTLLLINCTQQLIPIEPAGPSPLCIILQKSSSILHQVFAFPQDLQYNVSERGNQRERDRERAQARAGNKAKHPKDDGLTPEQRRERDAKALQEKAARKAASSGVSNNGVGRKSNQK